MAMLPGQRSGIKLVSRGKGPNRQLELYDLTTDLSESQRLVTKDAEHRQVHGGRTPSVAGQRRKEFKRQDYRLSDTRTNENNQTFCRVDETSRTGAKEDRHTIAYDGMSPNKMVCDTTLRSCRMVHGYSHLGRW